MIGGTASAAAEAALDFARTVRGRRFGTILADPPGCAGAQAAECERPRHPPRLSAIARGSSVI